MTNTATETASVVDEFTGQAREFAFDPPLESGERFAIVSAVVASMTGPETYLFPSDGKGNVTSWLELEGSRRGTPDIAAVVEAMGYQIKVPS